jgi:hypothetical protein
MAESDSAPSNRHIVVRFGRSVTQSDLDALKEQDEVIEAFFVPDLDFDFHSHGIGDFHFHPTGDPAGPVYET